MQHSEFLRGAGRYPSTCSGCSPADQSLSDSAFQLPGDPPAFDFLYKADKNLASNLSVRKKGILLC